MRFPISMMLFGATAVLSAAVLVAAHIGQLRAEDTADQFGAGSAAVPATAPTTPPTVPVTYVHERSGTCLDSNGDGDVYLLGCNGGDFQRWQISRNDDETWTFRNVATGRCLDSNVDSQTVGSLYALGCNGGDFQRWIVAHRGGLTAFRDKGTGLCLWDTPVPSTTKACDATTPAAEFWWKAA